MKNLMTKTLTFLLTTQLVLGSAITSLARKDFIYKEVLRRYELSQKSYLEKGPVSFIQKMSPDLSNQDQKMFINAFKGIPHLPEIKQEKNILKIVQKDKYQLQLEIVNLEKGEFKLDGQSFTISSLDTYQNVYEKLKKMKVPHEETYSSILNYIHELIFPSAHAGIDLKTILIGVAIAAVVAIVAYNIGKNNGKEQEREVANEQLTKQRSFYRNKIENIVERKNDHIQDLEDQLSEYQDDSEDSDSDSDYEDSSESIYDSDVIESL